MSSLGLYIYTLACLCPGVLTSDTNDLQGNDQTARLIEILTQLTSTLLFFFNMLQMVRDNILSQKPDSYCLFHTSCQAHVQYSTAI